jgi:glycerol-3-phosphate acyltransferase PlsY
MSGDWLGMAGGLAAAYLLGAIPASYFAGRAAGLDLREHGSRNLGATNVYRTLGWRFAIPVGLFDVGKGAVPAALFPGWFGGPAWAGAVYGAVAVMGHVFSAFVGFRGGKGVATAAGVFLVLAPIAVLASAAIWLMALAFTGYVSLSSILAALVFPAFVRLLMPDAVPLFWVCVVLAAFIVIKHQANIRRLLSGTESRFGRRPAS